MKLLPLFLTLGKIEPISISDALIMSLIGMLIVFVVLIVLMAVIKLLTALVEPKKKSALPSAGPVQPLVSRVSAQASAAIGKVPAIGSLGECALHSVDDKTAALLMAIVADDLKAPLNELRFISIREI